MIPSQYELLMTIARQKERIAYLSKRVKDFELKEELREYDEIEREEYDDDNEDNYDQYD